MNQKGEWVWKIAAIVTSVCAVTVTTIMVRRELGSASGTQQVDREPKAVKKWDELRSVGHRLGGGTPAVEIVEFADFECPACRRYAATALAGIRARFPNEVTIVWRHFPLSYHRFALPAAEAAECAADQNTFAAMHDLLYKKQDSLGLKSFSSFAAEVGIRDAAAFQNCLDARVSLPAIERDKTSAEAMGARGTPTLIINGLHYTVLPDSAALEVAILKLLGR